MAPVSNPTAAQLRDREMKELIKADVVRTCQEFPYFRLQTTKDTLQQVLYLWNAEHDLGYKQGMNELLAVILVVFDTERCENVVGCEPEYLVHDVYTYFDAMLTKLGIMRLYQETKDISEVSAEISRKAPDASLFGAEPRRAEQRRKQAELAYEREKSKVSSTFKPDVVGVDRNDLALWSHLRCVPY